MNFKQFAVVLEELELNDTFFVSESDAHEMLDIARQRRWPLSTTVVAKLQQSLKVSAPEGMEYTLLTDGSRVRHMFRVSGERSSLDDLEMEWQ